MAITSAISGGGASGAASASGAAQVAGGASSQSGAVASTASRGGISRDSHGNYARTSAESQGRISYSSGGSSSSSSGGNRYAGTVSISGGNGISGRISAGGGGSSSGGSSSGGTSPAISSNPGTAQTASIGKSTGSGSGGGSSGGSQAAEPVVVTKTPYISKEMSEAAQNSGGIVIGKSTTQSQSAVINPGEVGSPQNPILYDGKPWNYAEKPTGMEVYQQVLGAVSYVPIVGSTAKTIETVTINPKTGEFAPVAPFVYDVTQARLNEWNEFDGSGKERAAAGMDASIAIGMTAATLGTGALVGAGVKGLSLGLGKAAETKAGSVIVSKLTNPLIKGSGKYSQKVAEYSSPLNIGLNSVAGYQVTEMGIDVGKKFAESPQSGAAELAKVAVSLPAAVVGGRAGYSLTEKGAGYLKTKGLQYLPNEKYTVEGIPLSNKLTQDNLQVSFEKNIFYPKPDKIAETDKLVQDVKSSATLPKHPGQTTEAGAQIYHATNKPFGKEFEVIESESEIPSMMYGAPKAETYFTRITAESKSKPGILFNVQPSTGGEILNLKGTAVKKVDYDIAAKELGIPQNKLQNSADLQYKAADYFIRKYGKEGEFYIPGIKAEYEAGPKAGTKYKRLPTRYYTEVNGVRVRISEYEPVLGETSAVAETAAGKTKALRRVSYREYSGKPQKIPVSYSQGVSSKLQSVLNGSSRAAASSTGKGESSRLGNSSVRGISETLRGSTKGASESKTSSEVSKLSSVIYGNSSRSAISSRANYPGKKIASLLPKKKEDKRKLDIDFYSAAQRGRIDHLSIVDPLEMLGRGSMTNRKRADMTLYKQKIYIVDNQLSTAKPKGRIKQ